MKRKLLTDIDLRSRWGEIREHGLVLEEGTILTPAARDYIREQGIVLHYIGSGSKTSGNGVTGPAGDKPAYGAMTRTPVPIRGGKVVYKDYRTGEEMNEKPEDMTHLRGNLLVPKTHPRIEFRGRLDSLIADILSVQLTALSEQPEMVEELEELLGFVRAMLGAEVKDTPLSFGKVLGMDSRELRYNSHHIKETLGIEHPIPDCRMGRLCISLNLLRTRIRETELSAARAFSGDEGTERPDLIEALNRLSSCVYILFCRKLSGYYDRRKNL